MDATHPTRRRALAALMSPAALIGAGADAPAIYPTDKDKEAITADVMSAGRLAATLDPIPDDLAYRLGLHCTRMLRELIRRDRAGLR